MLTQKMNERLTQVGPGTPMGTLLRRYWYPVAALSELKANPTKAVRLLGEDLVLYQDRSGTLGLIEASCAHRRVHMLYGIPEERGLRCPYHGWLYDESGQCLEMPAEAPESTFPSRVQIKAYPVEALGGLVFAYLGPAPVPLLPQWDVFVRGNVLRDVGMAIVPCNWLQIMENSLDPVHTEHLHRYFTHYVMERLGKGKDDPKYWRFAPEVRPHVKIGFDVFEHGIIKRRVLKGDTERTRTGSTATRSSSRTCSTTAGAAGSRSGCPSTTRTRSTSGTSAMRGRRARTCPRRPTRTYRPTGCPCPASTTTATRSGR